MAPKGGGFTDDQDDLLREAAAMSDADLERAMAGATSARKLSGIESLAPGTLLKGVVVDIGRGEVLVELDGKSLGMIDESEFAEDSLPSVGDRIQARFERHDAAKGIAILSVGGVRREVLWDELHLGTVLEGTVSAVNKGGLTLDIKGERAFLPISQIERERVEDLAPYLGKRLRCEVTSFDRAARNLVVSRRKILEREAEAERGLALARLGEGEVLKGTVKRVTDHGAFIDIGGIDGLLPAHRIREHLKAKTLREPLREGQQVEVLVTRVERDRERVSLDFKLLDADKWSRAIEDYAAGDEVTGWVSRRSPEGAILSIDEGLEGILPEEFFHLLEEEPRPGTILKAAIIAIDPILRRVTLKPLGP